MPLVVSSLMGDASDVFDWVLSLNPGNTQDLTTLLQMLREHYCGSLTFREQRNTIENLHQKPQEAAIDFLIRVGTSVSNLGKDWKDELMDQELRSLQYEVSLNGVQEEIRHVLDSEIAKNGGKLTPQQMYEAVKRYKTYVARNKRLEGKGASSSASQPKAAGHASGYKPQFHKTTAFVATIAESEDDGSGHHESSSQEGANPFGAESSQEDDEGLFIPSYLEEALPDSPVLQVKMARAMQAQEVETRRCFTCNQQGHLQRDHWKYEEKNGRRPLQVRGPPLNKLAQEKVKVKLGQVVVNDVANKPIAPLHVDEVVRVTSKCVVPPFGHKAIHGKVNLILHGYKMNVMTHGLEKQSPSLPLGIDVQTVYATLADGSNRVTVVLRNNTRDWLEVKKGMPIAWMVAANKVPKVTNLFSAGQTTEQPTLTEAERQDLLLEKLDLSGLEAWPEDQAGKARSLLKEYHDIFLLEKHDMGHTNATKHKIVLKDPDTPPFKERFCRITPPQLDEVREHLKLMLDAGVIWPSNSPWCNAVVLVRKKDGSFRFCIDFRKLNSLTVKDSHPLPRICETLESLTGATHYSLLT